MREITVKEIEEGMEGIHEVDLTRRLKDFYKKKEQLETEIESEKSKENTNLNRVEKLTELFEDVKLCIDVYEDKLPLRIVERAKRSAGVYIKAEEYADSIKREAEDIKRHQREERE